MILFSRGIAASGVVALIVLPLFHSGFHCYKLRIVTVSITLNVGFSSLP
uniref:Uncharacterized protein n=1 Tax=Rhizophora mucronata TaxID=61149 RepID=A0A2P2QW03_RHIMU